MRRTIAILSILALAGTTPAAGQQRGTNCDITAYVIDQDAAGLNVRAGPSASAPVLRVVSNQGSGVARIREQRGRGSGCLRSLTRKTTRTFSAPMAGSMPRGSH